MVDLITLALTHGLMALAAIHLLSRDDLDVEEVGQKNGAKKNGKWRPPERKSVTTDNGEDA